MADKSKESKEQNSGMMPMLASMALVSVLAVGAGWFIAGQIGSPQMQPAQAKPVEDIAGDQPQETQESNAASNRTASGRSGFSLWGSNNAVRLEPIVSNLGSSGSDWIRIEVGLVMHPGETLGSEEDRMAVSEQIIAMLRRKTLADISGPSAFLQFREDLDDTVRLSTKGRAQSARILSLVIE